MGRNAASLFPLAVGAEMIQSSAVWRMAGMARRWIGRRSVQPCSDIHF